MTVLDAILPSTYGNRMQAIKYQLEFHVGGPPFWRMVIYYNLVVYYVARMIAAELLIAFALGLQGACGTWYLILAFAGMTEIFLVNAILTTAMIYDGYLCVERLQNSDLQGLHNTITVLNFGDTYRGLSPIVTFKRKDSFGINL